MRPDDPLAGKEVITKNDLLDVPLILPERMNVQSEQIYRRTEPDNRCAALTGCSEIKKLIEFINICLKGIIKHAL